MKWFLVVITIMDSGASYVETPMPSYAECRIAWAAVLEPHKTAYCIRRT